MNTKNPWIQLHIDKSKTKQNIRAKEIDNKVPARELLWLQSMAGQHRDFHGKSLQGLRSVEDTNFEISGSLIGEIMHS